MLLIGLGVVVSLVVVLVLAERLTPIPEVVFQVSECSDCLEFAVRHQGAGLAELRIERGGREQSPTIIGDHLVRFSGLGDEKLIRLSWAPATTRAGFLHEDFAWEQTVFAEPVGTDRVAVNLEVSRSTFSRGLYVR